MSWTRWMERKAWRKVDSGGAYGLANRTAVAPLFRRRPTSFVSRTNAFPWNVPITHRPDGAALQRYRYRTHPTRVRRLGNDYRGQRRPPGNSPISSPAQTNGWPDVPRAFKGNDGTRTETDDGHFNLPIKTRGKSGWRFGARPFDETSANARTKFSMCRRVRYGKSITSTPRCRPTD